MTLHPPASLNFLSGKGKWYVYITIPVELRPAFKGRTQLRRSTKTSDERIAKGKLHSIAGEMYAELDKARKELNPVKEALESLLKVAGYGPSTYLPEAFRTPESIAEVLEDAREAASAAKYGFNSEDEEEAILASYDRPRIESALEKLEYEAGLAMGTVKKTEHLSELAKDFLAKTSFRKEKTKNATKQAIEHFIQIQGDLIITDIVKKDAYDFASALSSKFANGTITNRINFVSQCLNFGEEEGRLPSNPFKDLKLNKYGKPKLSKKRTYDTHSSLLPTYTRSRAKVLPEVKLFKWSAPRVGGPRGMGVASVLEK